MVCRLSNDEPLPTHATPEDTSSRTPGERTAIEDQPRPATALEGYALYEAPPVNLAELHLSNVVAPLGVLDDLHHRTPSLIAVGNLDQPSSLSR